MGFDGGKRMGVWLWLNLGHNDAMVVVEVLQVFFCGDFGGWGLGLWVVVAVAMGWAVVAVVVGVDLSL